MMNKTKIEWCDFTYNPVTGCRHKCEYCYARRQAQRFCGDTRLNKGSSQLQNAGNGLWILEEPFKNNQGKVIPLPVGFEPTLHRYRLPMPAQKKKPANIFVCSMSDLFGEWVPDEWIKEVMTACAAAPWHNYLFLTKNPERYDQLNELALLPHRENFWYGTTITLQSDIDRLNHLPAGVHAFVSIEPIQEEIDLVGHPAIDWIIVGAETGNRKGKAKPQRQWIEKLLETAIVNKIPILMKHSDELETVMGEDIIQEFPAGLTRPADIPIPHCEECEHHKATERHYDSVKDTTAMNHICTARTTHKRVPGRYARTSPPWCPKRGGGDQ